MIITTTNSIENAKVEKYLGVVTANLVVGTGFFTDLTASFTDLFGGTSGAYRKELEGLYQRAHEELSLKATLLGANGILGFKIDFDEISGKGMQMFMISVSGTAVKLSEDSTVLYNESNVGTVSARKLRIELFKERWQARDKRYLPKSDELDFIMQNNLWELAESLFDYYITSAENDNKETSIYKKFPTIISLMNYDDIVKFIYKDYSSRRIYAFNLIRENNLFNAKEILRLLQENFVSEAIELLRTEKNEYREADVKEMEEICVFLDNLPDKGRIEEVKSGVLSSKMVVKYICPNGHKSEKDSEFCEDYDCGLNIKGLTHVEVDAINAFKDKVRIIRKLLTSK